MFINYFILFLLTAIIVYLLYTAIRRQQLLKTPTNYKPLPYSDTPTSPQTNQLNRIKQANQTGSGIANLSLDGVQDTTLRNFCIKSAFNSAYCGSYMNTNMIKYVLSRGCRFLDFEVYLKEGVPIVAYSDAVYDPDYTHYTSKNPALSLSGVFHTILANAFTETSPNPGDPLFIQLRIKSHSLTAFSEVAKRISYDLGDRLYSGKVTPDSYLSDLLGKIVVVVDKTTSPEIETAICNPSDLNCSNLINVTNMISGSDRVRIYRENDLTAQMTNPPDPGVYLMRIVKPQTTILYGVVNSNAEPLIKNYGAQVVLQCFYMNDNQLKNYEALFSKYKSAFVPISSIIA